MIIEILWTRTLAYSNTQLIIRFAILPKHIYYILLQNINNGIISSVIISGT
jgi:hypothetical protein